MSPRFLDVFSRLIGHEGGFQDDPEDDGNWTGGGKGRGKLRGTKFGISARSYPGLDIKNLTVEQAKQIYWRDFWLVAQCDRMNADADALVFDAAVNHGIDTAIRLLQRALGVADDGRFGPVSKAALETVAALHPDRLEARFIAHRLIFWARLTKFDRFGRGWTLRGAQELLAAMEH